MPKLKVGTVRMGALTGLRSYSICKVEDYSACARTLAEIQAKIWTEKMKRADIWQWYHNQRGGSCNG